MYMSVSCGAVRCGRHRFADPGSGLFLLSRLCHLQNNKTPVISTIWGLFIYNKMYLQFAHVSEYFHL